jgi:hypothetical protein
MALDLGEQPWRSLGGAALRDAWVAGVRNDLLDHLSPLPLFVGGTWAVPAFVDRLEQFGHS